MELILTIAGLIVVLIAVVLLRAMLLKPTTAKDAKIILDTSERAIEYGKKLSTMVQKETISSRFEADREKFYEFHEILEQLFPNVHSVCEKKVFDGSLLFKWRGTGTKKPILFMRVLIGWFQRQ